MDPITFEDAFAELEATVHKLEEGNLPLAQALALYERGVELARLCGRQLEAAELRVEQLSLSASDEDAETTGFYDDDDNERDEDAEEALF